MISRRKILLAVPALVLARVASAQYGGGAGMPNNGQYNPNDVEKYGKIFEPDKDLAGWFESLKRPDVQQYKLDHDGDAGGDIESCCDAGDAYPIEILQDAFPPHTGREENGSARVLDGSQRQIKKPSGEYKYRMTIKPENLKFNFAGNKYTREREGNPTGTAWAFLSVWGDGEIHKVYCIVPLPPSA